MALMEFLSANKLNTTGTIVAQSGNTGTVSYLFDRNTGLGFTTVGYESTSSAVLSIVFPSPTVLTNIMIQNHNLKQFRIYYDSTTANSLANFTTNSASSTYLSFASVTVNSIDIQMDVATAINTEKTIGEFILSERQVAFERNPSAQNFQNTTARTRVIHTMPDGGVTMYNIANKFRAKMKWEFITASFQNSLLTIYNSALPVYFVPFPTTTSWSGEAYEIIWTNDFEFSYSDNSKTQGFTGTIEIRQTSNT